MRPISLHLEGFAAFREPVDLDFEGLDYFALVGPTGAGKSTVIDAICFALYGSVPRYDDDRIVGKAISLGKTEARVSLTFDIGEQRYRATRVVRIRNGKASTPEALLEHVDAGGKSQVVLAERASQMRGAVERLVGLPFSHFTKCVVLPQGEFARFLHDAPAERQELLAKLLDLDVYKRVGQRARRVAERATAEVDVQRAHLAELAFATEDAKVEAERRRGALLEVLRAVDAAIPDDAQQDEIEKAARATAAQARELESHARAVEVPPEMSDLAARIEAADADLEVAELAAAAAEGAVRALEQEEARLPDRAELLRAREAHGAIVEVRARIDAARVDGETSGDALRRAVDALAKADELLTERRQAVDDLRAAHAAHALRGHLVVGEPCPVCGHDVEQRPRARKLATIDTAEAAVQDAQAVVDQARAAEREATRAVEAAHATLTVLDEKRRDLEAVADRFPDLDALAASLTECDRVREELQRARKADSRARRATEAARRARTELDRHLGTLRTQFHAQRDPLAARTPPPVGDDLSADWRALAAWAAEQRDSLEQDAAAADASADASRAARIASFTALSEAAAAAGVDVHGRDLAALRDEVLEAGLEARQALERVVEGMERAAKLREQIQGVADEAEVARLLAQQLRADHFEKWLVGEALTRLVAGASVTLRQLTGGNYSLACDDASEFTVIDHRNADERRSVRTLSGGETFQASLALALALADQISELAASGGAKLDSLFLDEGFGTLDAETLESVAGTIESLGSSGRMVGVVTHVPALAERVPVRFAVRPGARGATVEREEL